MLRMILVIIKHLKSYLEIFITKDDNKWCRNEFNSIVVTLNNYISKAQKYIEAKNSLLNHVKNKGREKRRN